METRKYKTIEGLLSQCWSHEMNYNEFMARQFYHGKSKKWYKFDLPEEEIERAVKLFANVVYSKYRVAFINKRLETDYRISYVSQYGGWNMYEIWDKGGAHHRGVLGFDCRKSNAEMLNYVDGIFELLSHYDVKQK